MRRVHFGSAPQQAQTQKPNGTATPGRDDFEQLQSARTRAAIEKADRERNEDELLKPYADVLNERLPRMGEWALMCVTDTPLSMKQWLVPQTPDSDVSAYPRHGIVRYLREQTRRVADSRVYERWVDLLRDDRPEDYFWSFITAAFADEGVMEHVVKRSWYGSERTLECYLAYFYNKLLLLFNSPYDPENANKLLTDIWQAIRADLLLDNRRAIVLNGPLKVMLVPLSRNAHRERGKELRQQQAAAMVAEALAGNVPAPATPK